MKTFKTTTLTTFKALLSSETKRALTDTTMVESSKTDLSITESTITELNMTDTDVVTMFAGK